MANSRNVDTYLKLAKIFKNKGFKLFLTGGTVRDFLLHIPLKVMDVATDATPEQVMIVVPKADDKNKVFGVIKYVYEGVTFEIATLRVDAKFDELGRPNKISYTTSLKKDYLRRDFTVNGMYLDSYFIVYDYCNGQDDIKNKVLRIIGNPKKKIKNNPLIIIRAIRFALMYGFSFEDKTEIALRKYRDYLKNIDKDKIKEEVNKIQNVDKGLLDKLFDEFAIHQYIDVVE